MILIIFFLLYLQPTCSIALFLRPCAARNKAAQIAAGGAEISIPALCLSIVEPDNGARESNLITSPEFLA
jgi:hypothetical protein